LAFLFEAVDETERRIRLAELRAICALILDWSHPVVTELSQAAVDPLAVDHVLMALAAVTSRCRREVLRLSEHCTAWRGVRNPK
jgi:hypothetical protein